MKKRESNIELLRIVSMALIVLYHIMFHGVLQGETTVSSNPDQLIALFMAVGGKTGVGIFVLISGFFLINKTNINLKSIRLLWSQVFFYSFGFLVLSRLLGSDSHWNVIDTIENLFPFIFNKYWFFTDYVIIMILVPFINAAVKNISRKALTIGLVIFGILWFAVPSIGTFLTHDVILLGVNEFITLIYMYILGGYFRLYKPAWLQNTVLNSGLIIVGLLITFLAENYFLSLGYQQKNVDLSNLAWQFDSLNSITVLALIVGLFGLFTAKRIGEVGWINKIASATFGVYLIHDNEFVGRFIWSHLVKSKTLLDSPWYEFIWKSLLAMVVIYIVASVVELIRKSLVEQNLEKLLNHWSNENVH